MNDRIANTATMLLESAREWGLTVTGDQRVSEASAAQLLSLAPRYLKKIRLDSTGPVFYPRGMDGCKISYRIHDLAEWIERARRN